MIALAAIIMAGSAGIPERTHHVYVYRQGHNQNYQCERAAVYVETLGFSSLTANGCVASSSDSNPWPAFPQQPIAVDLSIAGQRAKLFRSCTFVAHAMSANRNTSTVVDCR